MKHTWKRLTAMLFALALCMSLLPTALLATEAAAADDGTTTVAMTVTYEQTKARTMLTMINEFRTGDDAWYWNDDDTTKTTCTDLSELTYDYTLEAVAMQRAAEIALSYGHTRPNGENCGTALYVYYTWGEDLYARGENIAAGYNTFAEAADVFEAWQETDETYSGQGHRRNMLSTSYTAVGIAGVTYGSYHFWVQVFGKPETLNTTATAANDSETTVTIEVEDASVTSATVSTDTASYDLSCGDSAALPTVTAELTMENTWLSSSSRTVTVVSPTWSSSDTSVATVDNDNGVVHAVTKGSAGLTATALGETVTASLTVNHGATEIQNARDATCTEDGYTGDKVCSVCGETVSAGETIPATGHTTEVQNARDATCTEDGYTGDEVCTVCGVTVTAGKTIPATGHSYEASWAWGSDYTTATLTLTCSRCSDTVTVTDTTVVDNGDDSFTATATYDGVTYTKTTTTYGTGLHAVSDGTTRYYVDGEWQSDFVGFVKEDGKWYRVENGIVNLEFNGLGYQSTDGNYYYAVDGVVDFSFTGFVKMDGDWWYVLRGRMRPDFTGLGLQTDGYYYYAVDGKVDFTFTGFVKMDGDWYYIKKGMSRPTFTGLGKQTDGTYYYAVDGIVDFSYTGFIKHTDGKYYYVLRGRVRKDFTGLALQTDGNYYYAVNGVVDFSFTGFVKMDGSWYYVLRGRMRPDFTGLAKQTDGNYYYAENGIVNFDFTGIVKHTDGKYYYVRNGMVRFNYTGTVTYNGRTYQVVNGVAS